MNSWSVLVVDDENDICQLLEQWLKPLGHTVAAAPNGTTALRLAEHTCFDLVVTDVLMPDGDGPKLIEGLKRVQPAARVLAISGGGRYLDSNECLKIARGFGADAAIMKPFNREQFLAAVNETMTARAPARK
jgi:CheY-like chemotaxis protein